MQHPDTSDRDLESFGGGPPRLCGAAFDRIQF